MKKKILIHADFNNSIAIWNAMKLHILAMIRNDFHIIIIVDKIDYIETIRKDFNSLAIYTCESLKKTEKLIKKNNIDYIWCPNIFSVLKLSLIVKRYSIKIVFWIQGILPEESYMRNKSFLRKITLEILEKIALHLSDKFIFVSIAMRDYYLSKLYIMENNYAIVPCVSELKYNNKIQKIEKSFLYIGSLAPWQCFDKVLKIFDTIRKKHIDSILHIITLEKEKVENIICEMLINHANIFVYSIEDRSKLSDILSMFQFGFLIRENNIVNNVASPIKLAEYLSCGINIIIDNENSYFSTMLKEYNAGYIFNSNISNENIPLDSNTNSSLSLYNDFFSIEYSVNSYNKVLIL
jgi:glycosyltransferase involved in cell wall biosynthesis